MRTNVLLNAVLSAVGYDENHWSRSLYRYSVEFVVTTETSNMLKKILIGSLVCAALTIAVPAQAQSQAPASPTAPTTGQASEITAQEVQQFANALKQMRSIHDQAQTQAGEAIQGQGLTVQRFNEILQSQRAAQGQPSGAAPSTPAQPSTPASPEEQQKFDQALTQITQIQQSVEQRMEQAITGAGLNVQRFNQIFTIARQDQGLKQRIEQVLQN
jgi:Domain of unknown function (DUF4168)